MTTDPTALSNPIHSVKPLLGPSSLHAPLHVSPRHYNTTSRLGDDGIRVRTRLFFYAEHVQECSAVNLIEKEKCNIYSCNRLQSAYSEGTLLSNLQSYPIPEICQEEKEEGQCGGTFPRYWYNNETNTCERFIFSGCKGNRNQFETEEECKNFCIPDYKHNAAICNPLKPLKSTPI